MNIRNPSLERIAEDVTVSNQPDLPLADGDDDTPRTLEDFEPPAPEWVERVYRYMAEGNIAAAMDEFSREFGLAPPSHAKAVADLLTSARG
ncbi:hypothetical protein [Ensifer sp. ENS08]|uniref:hypothetical protein n=1 Tax=Ensifer sp. ENS08 TaxID=2769273 RepID=UPI0017816A33|nr:hypothetical protein [Ensifer sp. ENS08]MBD9571729.1 hypothetical protein [Ensifer sp. ENS08]